MSLKFIEAVQPKDRALQNAIRAFAIIRYGGHLEPHEAKIFIDQCSLALPMRYRFTREQWEIMEQNVRLSLEERTPEKNVPRGREGVKMFDLNDWKKRFDYNADEAERNSYMDSGWSPGTADRCMRTAGLLWRELAIAIAATETKPEDYFDRPELVAIQEAARYATTPATPAQVKATPPGKG